MISPISGYEPSISATNRLRRTGVLVHLGISTLHGAAHEGSMVRLTTFGNLYVVVVITLAPLVAAGLLFTRLRTIGTLLLALSMLGSFSFGFWYHFFSTTNDNVVQVHGPWHFMFLWTAIALAVVELAGVWIGLIIYRTISRLKARATDE